MSDDTHVSTALRSRYLSLLGGVAWLVQTRADICIYVVALQRHAQSPRAEHVRSLNTLLRYIKNKPPVVEYKPLKQPVCLLVVSDSAFKRESDSDALAMKGCMICKASVRAWNPLVADIHVLEYFSKKQRHVSRSTFAAELFAFVDAADAALHIGMHLTECMHGVYDSVRDLARLREGGGYALPIYVFLDAYAVFAAIKAEHVSAYGSCLARPRDVDAAAA